MKMIFILLVIFSIIVGGCKTFSSVPPDNSLTPEGKTPLARLSEAAQSSNWLITLSILGIALSTAAFLNGSRAALGFLIGSITALVITLTVNRFASWFAVLGLVGSVGLFAYTVYERRKNITELIKTVEVTKDFMLPEHVIQAFKSEESPVNNLQSKSTKKLVDSIKRKVGA